MNILPRKQYVSFFFFSQIIIGFGFGPIMVLKFIHGPEGLLTYSLISMVLLSLICVTVLTRIDNKTIESGTTILGIGIAVSFFAANLITNCLLLSPWANPTKEIATTVFTGLTI